ncbi:hypothetical protein F6R83_10225 [Citrobacter amalonaticus]|nr:hypothetical protein [Citrobacter amalonaticus]
MRRHPAPQRLMALRLSGLRCVFVGRIRRCASPSGTPTPDGATLIRPTVRVCRPDKTLCVAIRQNIYLMALRLSGLRCESVGRIRRLRRHPAPQRLMALHLSGLRCEFVGRIRRSASPSGTPTPDGASLIRPTENLNLVAHVFLLL